MVRSLAPGERVAVHWADMRRPLRVVVRVQEPGWTWSGSVDMACQEPGDLFIKVGVSHLRYTINMCGRACAASAL